MDNRIQYQPNSLQPNIQAVQLLYNRYAGMLMGYILDVVKDEQQAEQYLIDIFKEISFQLNEFNNGTSDYCKLQMLARKKLSPYFSSVADCTPEVIQGKYQNPYIIKMSEEQRLVFCSIHYHGKTAASLAADLNTDEVAIRKILKEAFAVIRNTRKDAGVH